MKYLFLVIMLFTHHFSSAQPVIELDTFIVVQYESHYNLPNQSKKVYAWIAPLSSSDSLLSNLSPIPDRFYSTKRLMDCANNIEVPIDMFIKDYDELVDDNYANELNLLFGEIDKNKIIYQTSRTKWGKYKKKTKIYLTPVVGIFLSCPADRESKRELEFVGMLRLPYSDIRVDMELINKIPEIFSGLGDLYRVSTRNSQKR